MTSGFRISIGNPVASEYKGADPLSLEICAAIKEKTDNLKNLSYQQLSSFQSSEVMSSFILGKEVCFTTFVECHTEDDILLVVVQAYLPTWKSPNHFSITGLARVFVDGFSVGKSRQPISLEPESLHQFA